MNAALVGAKALFKTNAGVELVSTAAPQVVDVLVKLDKPPARIVYDAAVAPACGDIVKLATTTPVDAETGDPNVAPRSCVFTGRVIVFTPNTYEALLSVSNAAPRVLVDMRNKSFSADAAEAN